MVMIGSQGEHGTMIGNSAWFLGCRVRNVTAATIKTPLMPAAKNAQLSPFRMPFDIVMRTAARHERLRTNKNTAKVALSRVIVLGFFLVLLVWMSLFSCSD